LSGLKDRAIAQGIRADVFDAAMNGIRYNTDVIDRDRNQAEFSKAIWDYLDTTVSDARIANGCAALSQQSQALSDIKNTYGLDREIVVAIRGLESAYGAVRGRTPIIEAMATLAYDGLRAVFFEEKLIAALLIVQNGDATRRDMVGSWAGAMDHTQFMPTSYQSFAVDGNGDGTRDIWGDDPVDALAFTANYLKRFGWVQGQPWGVEVQLPDGFDYSSACRDNRRLPSAWTTDGARAVDGQTIPDHTRASILLPADHEGVALMIFPNFAVLEEYNTAESYVIGVGHLADRIAGGGAIQTQWPRADGALSGADRIELQERLTYPGFDTVGIDGRIGPLTLEAIRQYQAANNLVPDGYASPQLLRLLR
jgi:lytic murein transglycosylase